MSWIKKMTDWGVEVAMQPLVWGVYLPFYGLRLPERLFGECLGSDE